MHAHHQHRQLWLNRKTTDKLQSRANFAIDKHDPSVYLHELSADPTGFAFGGVFPGTLHAKGKLFGQHRVSYSIGRAGAYRGVVPR